MKAIVKEAAKYVGISTGIALGIFCFVGMIFDLYYGGNFSLSGYQFTKMVLGCVVVGWGFGVPAVVYRKENMPMPIRVVIHMGSGCVIYTLDVYKRQRQQCGRTRSIDRCWERRFRSNRGKEKEGS